MFDCCNRTKWQNKIHGHIRTFHSIVKIFLFIQYFLFFQNNLYFLQNFLKQNYCTFSLNFISPTVFLFNIIMVSKNCHLLLVLILENFPIYKVSQNYYQVALFSNSMLQVQGVPELFSNCEINVFQSKINSLLGSRRPGLISIRQMDEKPRLIYHSEFVVKVVKFAENVLNSELKEENWLKKVFFDYCNIKIGNGFVSLYGNIFKSMDNHSYELMKVIVPCFLLIHLKRHDRLINERIKKQNLRSKLMKIILQNHQ